MNILVPGSDKLSKLHVRHATKHERDLRGVVGYARLRSEVRSDTLNLDYKLIRKNSRRRLSVT